MALLPMVMHAAANKKKKAIQQPVIVEPQRQCPTAFAIITDNKTYEQCKEALLHYRDAVEHDGLSTYMIYADWKNPMEVRTAISRLYGDCPSLEGIVLVGDVPIAMIRNAQHTTTAFKMNEETFGIRESSVPSDRFYDDLHLQFRFLQQDPDDKALFYYQLTEESPQSLRPTFYSARIRHTEGIGGDKYAAVSAFLEKAALAKYDTAANPLDQVVTYNGGSYNYDCVIVYMDEEKAYRENFPLAFQSGTSFKHWNFRMNQPMKYKIFSELQRTDLDLFMFHEHGTPNQQLVNEHLVGNSSTSRYQLLQGDIYSAIRSHVERKHLNEDSLVLAMQQKFHLTPAFFKDYKNPDFWKNDSIADADVYISTTDLKGRTTNARMVMFDACYNGSFQDSDYVAGHYLFNGGKTLVCQANTRNVLQDRWTIEMVGLLSHGLRVGQYNRQVATLEGHLVGDPTVHFSPIQANSLSQDVVLRAHDAAYWHQQLQSPYADIQCLALRKLADIDTLRQQSAFFLSHFKKSRLNTVRMECLQLLSRYANADFTEAVRIGLHDPYERIARSCATYAGCIADPVLVDDVISVLQGDEERVRAQYALNSTLFMFDEEAIINALQRYFDTADRTDIDNERKRAVDAIRKEFADKMKREQVIFNKQAKDDSRMMSIRLLRNYPRTGGIDRYLQFIADDGNPEQLRVIMAEALGWFNYSYRRADIIKGCQQLLNTPDLPELLRAELTQTINRLK